MEDGMMNRRGQGWRTVLLAGVSALSLLGTTPMMAVAETPPGGMMVSYADVVAKAKPAVVTILTEINVPQDTSGQDGGDGSQMPPDEFFRRFFGENGPFQGMPFPGNPGGQGQGQGQGQGMGPMRPVPQQKGAALGSGFIVSADGTVVTNHHVVDNATKITVKLDDGTELPAKVVGFDAKNDIAVLKVEPKAPLPVIAWGNSDALRLGDPILAIGDPFGIGPTVTAGIVSARGRDLHNGPYDDFIQVDAAINHGNSGGPLIDEQGEVVGINTAIYSPNGGNVGVGFAIPAAQAQKVVEKIIQKGTIEHGFIGVGIQPVDEQIAGAIGLKEAKGALVASVVDGSPAAKAGIKVGDVVRSVNGTAISDPRSLSRAIADLSPGDKATLDVWHEGAEKKVEITIGKNGDQMASAGSDQGQAAPTEGQKVAALGLTVTDASADQAGQLGLPEGTTGVVVSDIDAKGPAADKGLEQGDVIESINQSPVTTTADLEKAVKEAKDAKRDAVLLLVNRQGQKSFIAVPLVQN